MTSPATIRRRQYRSCAQLRAQQSGRFQERDMLTAFLTTICRQELVSLHKAFKFKASEVENKVSIDIIAAFFDEGQ